MMFWKTFSTGVFELADMWCLTAKAREYCAFLDALLLKIKPRAAINGAERQQNAQSSWKGAISGISVARMALAAGGNGGGDASVASPRSRLAELAAVTKP